MLIIGSIPPNAVYESWKELTAPVEVSVVDAAKVAESETPKRTSLPSIAAPMACGTVPLPASSNPFVNKMLATASSPMTARMAYPWRLSLTILPNKRGRLNGITRRRKISNQFVQLVGFSNG
jgi:hypothetical protein